MIKSHLTTAFFIICFFCCGFVTSFPVPTPPVLPRPDQVAILLAFKDELPSRNCDPIWNVYDRFPRINISSWIKDKDPRSYDGVLFDDETGVVTGLSLHGACISGTIQANSSLFKLQHLRFLDLSKNHFSSPFPAGLGRLANLDCLDLRQNGFSGEFPSSISNLSRLDTLDLSYNKLSGRFPLIHNLTLFSSIDLSRNNFSGTIPSSLFTMPSLKILDLRQNQLRDPLENMSSSATSGLYHIDMAENLFSCRILEPISKLAKLTYLDLSFQNTTYTINFDFLPFRSLEYLDLSGNSISTLNTSGTNLLDLILSNCNITEFPMFIKTLPKLQKLDISKNRLIGKVPEWLWDLPSLSSVNISYNSVSVLEGSPKVLLNSSLGLLDLSGNAFQGSFPIIPPSIQVMAASNNHFSGGIPLTLCNVSYLELLDLSNNNFNGSIPRCLNTARALKLGNNNLSGRLPDIEKDTLELLDVSHNQISGKLPRSLVNCEALMFLNVESNQISDTFPFWLKALEYLEVMVLRSNRLHGPISSPQYHLPFPALRVIDISHNNFNGSLPPNYFANWSAPLVSITQDVDTWPWYMGSNYVDYITPPSPLWMYPSMSLRNKGLNMEFEKIQGKFTAIDFSGNMIEGHIPESIGVMKSLMVLDLSNNNFTGHIPSSLANLTQLESLDLSRNHLSGKIPQELRALTFLAYVNMSNNKLTGQIPQGTQIGGQPKSCFEGNIDLCGLPLQESCFKENGEPTKPQAQEPEQEQLLNWKAAAIGYGPGVLFGVAIAQGLATYKPLLFYKLFRL